MLCNLSNNEAHIFYEISYPIAQKSGRRTDPGSSNCWTTTTCYNITQVAIMHFGRKGAFLTSKKWILISSNRQTGKQLDDLIYWRVYV